MIGAQLGHKGAGVLGQFCLSPLCFNGYPLDYHAGRHTGYAKFLLDANGWVND